MTTAKKADFGNPTACEPQTREMTLTAIEEVIEEVGKDDLAAYRAAAKARGLNGVAEPFLEKLVWCADPSEFYVPTLYINGSNSSSTTSGSGPLCFLERRKWTRGLSVLQLVVGYRHFGRGVTRFKQHTGREQRDLMRYFVSIVAGPRQHLNG